MAFNIDDPLGSLGLSGIGGDIYSYVPYLIWGVLLAVVAYFGYNKYRDKKIFVHPVRIFRQRNNGMVRETNTFGGYITEKGIIKFIIKMGMFKKKEADKIPLSEYMDEDNRIYYWQISPESPLIQVKRDFVVQKILIPNTEFKEPTELEKQNLIKSFLENVNVEEEYKDLSEEDKLVIAKNLAEQEIEYRKNIPLDITSPTYTPVPTNLKQQALYDINSYKNTLGIDVNKQFAYFVIGVIALLILGAVIFYIAVNQGDIPILTK